MSLTEFYQKRFFMRKYGNITHAEIAEMSPFEFDMEWNLTHAEIMRNNKQQG